MADARRKGSGRSGRLAPEPVDERLVAAFVEIVEAVTPYRLFTDWTPLWHLLPHAAAAHPAGANSSPPTGCSSASTWSSLLSSGTGSEAGRDAQDIADDLVSRPWQRLELAGWERTLENLRKAAVEVIDDACALAAGRTVQVPARFMFDGPQMSKRFTRDTGFGRVCWTEIPLPYAEAPPFSGLTVFTRMPLHLLDVPGGEYFYAHTTPRW